MQPPSDPIPPNFILDTYLPIFVLLKRKSNNNHLTNLPPKQNKQHNRLHGDPHAAEHGGVLGRGHDGAAHERDGQLLGGAGGLHDRVGGAVDAAARQVHHPGAQRVQRHQHRLRERRLVPPAEPGRVELGPQGRLLLGWY